MKLLDLEGKSEKERNVEILGFIHYIVAAFTLLVTIVVVPMIFFASMMPLLAAGNAEAGAPIGCVSMVVIVSIFFALAVSLASAALTAAVGWCLQNRRGYYFVVVMACLNLLSIPLGTALGVATLVLVFDPEIQPQFGAAGRAEPPKPTPSGESSDGA